MWLGEKLTGSEAVGSLVMVKYLVTFLRYREIKLLTDLTRRDECQLTLWCERGRFALRHSYETFDLFNFYTKNPNISVSQ